MFGIISLTYFRNSSAVSNIPPIDAGSLSVMHLVTVRYYILFPPQRCNTLLAHSKLEFFGSQFECNLHSPLL